MLCYGEFMMASTCSDSLFTLPICCTNVGRVWKNLFSGWRIKVQNEYNEMFVYSAIIQTSHESDTVYKIHTSKVTTELNKQK